mmetsp:Transcript_65189/g.103269  ORF Transcript_65189/g.103269 Transcript_65189/m.103269 type:complete len:536 (+) Transcript_65189:83-1690(+)|eukprot:CAMPEP_0169071262 /NCGR_PEP_ID=MMETSP1015-20121227/5564_1 /TAXON_ID=342587 /ORGANISM="Karlodinium micrum, Strain CCMP2283" /LENGTH=535 /DNA_ID=CAMNT_0009130333 /DNA_START=45 /DNA_END=1652 /DNA_ORIENTATION=-
MVSATNPPSDASLNKFSIEYSYSELSEITNNFDISNELGKGSYGAVYHGVRRDGTDVAIKVLEIPDESGFEEEVRVLSKFRHPNLVILMGFARRDSARYLIYEMLAGGDCYERLQKCRHQGIPFTWQQRVSASFDASCGLSHLHNATPKVFHRDIKTANILLDRNGSAKMADFGLACVSHSLAHKVQKTAGTMGYACPLYATRSVVTEGSEVYSFGVVMLEMLTSICPAVLLQHSDGSQHYKFLVCEVRGSADLAVHMSDERAGWPVNVAASLAQTALRCVADMEEYRPGFAEIVHALRQLRDYATQETRQTSEARHIRKQVVETCVRTYTPSQNMTVVRKLVAQRPVPKSFTPAFVSGLGHLDAALVPQSRGVESLWHLRCIYADVEDLSSSSEHHFTIVHWQELGATLASTLRVGRMFQDMFTKLGGGPHVSREHFQIWAEELDTPRVFQGGLEKAVPCLFYLTNFSMNGTFVNGSHIDGKCRQVQIHHGDTIAIQKMIETDNGNTELVPHIQFEFDLSRSILYDASLGDILV